MHRLKLLASLLAVLASTGAQAWTWNSAQSYCSVKRQFGYASARDQDTAVSKAIRACVENGGIPDCCKNDARVVWWAYAATSTCTATGKTGMGLADTQARANEFAVAQCVESGGIESCCRKGLSE